MITQNRQGTYHLYGEDEIFVESADAACVVLIDEGPVGTTRQVGGAAALGGLAAFLVAGPVVGVIAAGATAAVATSQSKAGDIARKGGDVMADAAVRLKRFNREHHVVEKATKGVKKGYRCVVNQFKES